MPMLNSPTKRYTPIGFISPVLEDVTVVRHFCQRTTSVMKYFHDIHPVVLSRMQHRAATMENSAILQEQRSNFYVSIEFWSHFKRCEFFAVEVEIRVCAVVEQEGDK
ncbi:hypothetical protein BS50DRAFT_587586 [Corynespora cassiicola Philippines]|uniref:Uncharacterized protein n=1 Tax=Corynespora cassiicola Philippines TaxID=1448308 RepID=A0A2T2NSQ6_CORCC|nr:hypothetical protein BS50DRAFT_587586 [Corynespora cassiicola Philippines]